MVTDTTPDEPVITIKPIARRIKMQIAVQDYRTLDERTVAVYGRRITVSARYGTVWHNRHSYFVDRDEFFVALDAARARA